MDPMNLDGVTRLDTVEGTMAVTGVFQLCRCQTVRTVALVAAMVARSGGHRKSRALVFGVRVRVDVAQVHLRCCGCKREDLRIAAGHTGDCLLYTSPSPRDRTRSRMPSSA
eukprot:TRINITY_DN7859_c0_g1_i1.p2 TRINITY_DN7859_c0_g1~~TRINITY_DN7859_c0_g1_i1.p2  ORF type:complete len:111 (+),score=32.11 TRINITY_DN7859_c0_g1_i1:195-527(+)